MAYLLTIRHEIMSLPRSAVPILAQKYRWLSAITLTIFTGIVPITVSGLPEFCTILVAPFILSLLINRCWNGPLKQLVLACSLPLVGSLIRLMSSSIHDGADWFSLVFRWIRDGGIEDPYLRQILIVLLCPVVYTIVCTASFMLILKPKSYPG
jgi:hypothetical protein